MKTGYIYKIWSVSNPEMVYYGSTQQQVCKRLNDHRRDYDRWKKTNNRRLFTSSFLIIDMGEYEYATLESMEFEEKFELKNRERFYIENNTCVNCRVPNRTNKEWYEENREILSEKKKIYAKANKEKFDDYNKKYQEENKEKIREQKTSVVKKQKYEEAAKLRDDEKKVERNLLNAQEEWNESSKKNRILVEETDIADVVSMMTNIPVNKVIKSEKNKRSQTTKISLSLIYPK